MGELTRVDFARFVVRDYIEAVLDKSDPPVEFETYIVWFCYILGGWKALVSSTLPDGMYYEVSYNKDKNEHYLDAYKKVQNICVETNVWQGITSNGGE